MFQDKLVIIVDDDAQIRSLTYEIVASLGFKTEAFESGLEGARRMNAKDYDLLITDNQNGERKSFWGVELVQRSQHFHPEAKTILMSTEQVEQHTANRFILKGAGFIDNLEKAILSLMTDSN